MTTNASKLALILTTAVLLIIGAVLAVRHVTRDDRYNSRSKTFRSRAGRFSITFPNRPKKGTQAVQTMTGKLEITSFHADYNNVQFSLTYVDLPEEYLSTLDPCEPFLDLASDEANSYAQRDSIEQTRADFHGYPGVRLNFRDAHDRIVYSRQILIGSRAYVLQVAAEEAISDPAQITRFFESFTVDGLQ